MLAFALPKQSAQRFPRVLTIVSIISSRGRQKPSLDLDVLSPYCNTEQSYPVFIFLLQLTSYLGNNCFVFTKPLEIKFFISIFTQLA